MKHIRLFEGFNTDEYYVKITYDEQLDLSSESSEGYDCLLTDREKLWIEENLPVEYWQDSNNEDIRPWPDAPLPTRLRRDIAIGASSNGSGKFLFLYKIEDDYFLCGLNEDEGMLFQESPPSFLAYYKCDQFEGLLMLLKDKKVI